MKVLHLHKDYLPLTQQWVYLLMKHLPDVENHIAAQHYLQHNFYDTNFRFVTNHLDSVFRFNNQLDKRHPKAILQKALIKSLPFFLGKTDQQLIRYVKEQNIDLIHAHFAPVAWQFRRLIRLKIPFAVSFYGYDYEHMPFLYPIFINRYRWLFRHAQAFICEGTHGAEKLEQMGCPTEKLKVVPLGVQIKATRYFDREKKTGTLKLVQVASFAGKKGQVDTLKAFYIAQKECPNLQLTLVGGPREPTIKRQVLSFIKEKKIETIVTIMDHFEYNNLAQFFRNYHVFIHPSQYTFDRDCEGGAPVILMDAMASGLPIITTTHCDIPFVVKHGKTGFLSQEKDIAQLAHYIKHFYEMDQDTYNQMSRAARNHVVENFDITTNAAELKQVYSEMAAL